VQPPVCDGFCEGLVLDAEERPKEIRKFIPIFNCL